MANEVADNGSREEMVTQAITGWMEKGERYCLQPNPTSSGLFHLKS